MPPDLVFNYLGPADGYAMIKGAPWAQAEIDAVLGAHFPGARQGFTLVSLVIPGQTIPEHTDHKEGCTKRVHIPLTTDPECVFVTGGVEHFLRSGFAWLIDPTLPHSVIHRGSQDRIHLMFNVLEEEHG